MGSGASVLSGQQDKDSLFGGPARDFLYGGSEDDRLEGGDGDNDNLDGGTGTDLLDGGPGVLDLVSYEFRTGGIQAQIGSATGGAIGENDQITTTVEDLRGGLGNDLLVGDARDNRLEGFLGNDILIGMQGADRLTVSDGNDILISNGSFNQTDDGARDTLLAQGGPNVTCVFSTTDPDFASGC